MGFPGWIAVRYEYRRQIGRALSFIRLHRLEYTTLHGVDVVRKRRKWLACWLIPLGNQFLKISGNPVVALSTKHWIDWERAIDRAIEQDRVFPAANDGSSSGRDLVSRKVPGISLHDLLSNSQYSLSQKMDMIRWSLVALRTLHRCHADWGDGRHQSPGNFRMGSPGRRSASTRLFIGRRIARIVVSRTRNRDQIDCRQGDFFRTTLHAI